VAVGKNNRYLVNVAAVCASSFLPTMSRKRRTQQSAEARQHVPSQRWRARQRQVEKKVSHHENANAGEEGVIQ